MKSPSGTSGTSAEPRACLAVIEFTSYGAGLYCANELASSRAGEILEMIPAGSGLTLLISGDKFLLNDRIQKLSQQDNNRGAFGRSTLIDGPFLGILRSLYSLDQSTVQDSMAAIEGTSAGELMALAQKALNDGIGIVDLKVPRGGALSGYLIVTSEQVGKLEGFLASSGASMGGQAAASVGGQARSTLIRGLCPAFRTYFEILPKNSSEKTDNK